MALVAWSPGITYVYETQTKLYRRAICDIGNSRMLRLGINTNIVSAITFAEPKKVGVYLVCYLCGVYWGLLAK